MNFSKKIIIFFILFFASITNILALGMTGEIDNTQKWAWGDQIGWINFKTNFSNIIIDDNKITGYAWSDVYGWINMQPTASGVKNDANGNLSGSAWGQGTGWIDFSGVSIDAVTGKFSGTATTALNGSIIFSGSNFSLKTSWSSNNAPVDINLSNTSVQENIPIIDPIGVLTTDDLDATDIFTYSKGCSIAGADDDKFYITGDKLKKTISFDFENPVDVGANNSYEVCIKTDDNRGGTFEKKFLISVSNTIDTINDGMSSVGSDDRFYGWAWSDNIGWISMNCSNTNNCGKVKYGVTADSDGNISGFAWSDNAGWLDFEYYGNAKFDIATSRLSGDAQFLGGLWAEDGWHGKVSLSGTSPSYGPKHNVSSDKFDGFAWGSDIVGWIDFSEVVYDPFYFKFTSNKGTPGNKIGNGGSVLLQWATEGGVTSCTASHGDTTSWKNQLNKTIGYPATSSETISNITGNTRFTLTCKKGGKEITRSLYLIASHPEPVVIISADDTNIPSNTKTGLTWSALNVSDCKATSGDWDGFSVPFVINIGSGRRGETSKLRSGQPFEITCQSSYPTEYPGNYSDHIFINVEKPEVELRVVPSAVPYNSKITIKYRVEFVDSCVTSAKASDPTQAIEEWELETIDTSDTSEKSVKPIETRTDQNVVHTLTLTCKNSTHGEIKEEVKFKIGKNPKFSEI